MATRYNMLIHNIQIVILAAIIVLTPAMLWSHGIVRTIEQGKAMVITTLYDDGEPISYAAVKIFSPGDRKVEYQNGRTDKNGRFAFVPSEAGDWLVRLSDGMGHGFEEHVRVDADLRGTSSTPVLVKLGQKAIVILLLSWGGIMTALYMRKKKPR